MSHIQTSVSQVKNILSTVELTARLKQDKNDVRCCTPVSSFLLKTKDKKCHWWAL